MTNWELRNFVTGTQIKMVYCPSPRHGDASSRALDANLALSPIQRHPRRGGVHHCMTLQTVHRWFRRVRLTFLYPLPRGHRARCCMRRHQPAGCIRTSAIRKANQRITGQTANDKNVWRDLQIFRNSFSKRRHRRGFPCIWVGAYLCPKIMIEIFQRTASTHHVSKPANCPSEWGAMRCL